MTVLAPNGFELLKFPGSRTLTNRISVGSFESTLAAWDSNSGALTLSLDSSQAHSGTQSMKVVVANAATANNYPQRDLSMTIGKYYVIGAWVKVTSVATATTMTLGFSGAGLFNSVTRTIATNTWQYLEVGGKPTSAGTCRIFFNLNARANGDTFYIDEVVHYEEPSFIPGVGIATDGSTASRTYPLGEVPRFMAGKVSPYGFDYWRKPGSKTITNIVDNGGAETNLTVGPNSWSGYGTVPATVTRDTTEHKFGSACIKVVTAGANTNEGVSNCGNSATDPTKMIVITPDTFYVFSGWVKGTISGNFQFLANTFTTAGASVSSFGFNSRTLIGEWQRFSILFYAGSTATRIRLSFGTNNATAATFYVDGVQLEKISSPNLPFDTPYIETNGSTASITYPLGEAPHGLVTTPGVVKTVTPATINATSTISGNVSALRRITVGGITAASTLSTNVVARRRIAPSNINAQSSLSASVVSKRAILPGNINATSSINTNVTVLKHITSGNITALSTLSSNIVTRRAILSAQISAQSALNTNVTALKHITSININAASTLSSSIVTHKAILPGNINALSALNGSIRTLKHIAPGNINAISTLSGSVVVRRAILPSNINVQSVLSTNISILRFIVPANINATSTVAANIHRLVYVTPTNINCLSAFNAAVGVLRKVQAANLLATSTITGALVVTYRISTSNIIVATTLSTHVSVAKLILPGNIYATSTLFGGLKLKGPLLLFKAEVINRNWFAATTDRNWSATPTLPIRDWNVSLSGIRQL